MAESQSEFLLSAVPVPSIMELFLLFGTAALLLTPLEIFFPAQRQSFLRRKELLLDMLYWFFTPLASRVFTNSVIILVFLVISAVFGVTLSSVYLQGFGPLAVQPLWLQTLEVLFLADGIDYFTHRFLHTSRLWRIHAIHHSPEEINWISSARVHPLNDLITRTCQVVPLLLLGFSTEGILMAVPYLTLYVMFLHSNLSWDFGMFRYVLVSPAYHRWHHTSDDEGIDKNFAGIFPVWDIIFGTLHFPRSLPVKYGVHGEPVPESFLGQLAYPFKKFDEPRKQ